MNSLEIAEKDNWGFLREAEVSVLKSLVHLVISDKTSPPLFVNLGSGHGTSSLAMAEACPEADIYSVDNNLWFMECERKTFNEAGKKQPHQIHSNCHDPDLVFEHEADLIFVDADHRENEVRADILKWFQYIRNKGIIAFHDYGHPNYPGVKIAVDELMDGQEEILFIETIKAFRCMT